MNTPIKELKLGLAYDYAAVANQNKAGAAAVPGTTSGYANAIGIYATYQATEKLSLNSRGEYASHSAGAQIGNPAKVIEFTETVQYDLWKNVISRLEFRWDHAADGAAAFGGATGAAVLAGHGLRNSEEVIANIIYKF